MLSLYSKKKASLKQEEPSDNSMSEVKFICYFPSLVRLIKLELCDLNEVLAVEYLNLDFISDYKNKFLLPTLGPCYVDFCTEPYCCRLKKSYFIDGEA